MPEAGFLLAESEAVKKVFDGLTVSDDRNGTRPVRTFFRWPAGEIEKAYPFITVDLVGIVHAKERQHSDQYIYAYDGTPPAEVAERITPATTFNYWPDTAASIDAMVAGNGYRRTVEFVPINLYYQVATHCRDPRHDIELMGKLFATNRIPFRYGYVEIPIDDTIRRLDLLSWSQSDLHDGEASNRRKIFRKVFTLQTTAELAPFQVAALNTVSSVQKAIETF